MPRKRMLDPSIWEDEHFGKLSDQAKILFISCISNADDDGRLSANPMNVRAMAFRFSDLPLKKIESLISEIKDNMINFKMYSVNGCRYIQLLKWEEYQTQKTDRRKPSKFPPYDSGGHLADNGGHLAPQDKLSKVKLSEVKIGYSGFEETTLTTWNSFCDKNPILSKVKEISGKRRTALKNRFTQKSFLDFGAILAAAQEQPFCMGKNDRGWKISFDWLIANDTNYLKVFEYKYSDTKGKPEYQDVNPDCKVCLGKGVIYNQSTSSTVVCSCRIKKV